MTRSAPAPHEFQEVRDVAVVLAASGSRQEAAALLRAAGARHGASEETVSSLLDQVQTQGDISLPATAPVLNLRMVQRWLKQGRIMESLALLSGARLTQMKAGAKLAAELSTLLAPLPKKAAPRLQAAYAQLLHAQTDEAIETFEAAQQAGELPSWGIERLNLLRLVLQTYESWEQDERLDITETFSETFQSEVQSAFEGAGLIGVRDFVTDSLERTPNHRPAQQLNDAIHELLDSEASQTDASNATTQSIHGLSLIQSRLAVGDLERAWTALHDIVIGHPQYMTAQRQIDSLRTLYAALGKTLSDNASASNLASQTTRPPANLETPTQAPPRRSEAPAPQQLAPQPVPSFEEPAPASADMNDSEAPKPDSTTSEALTNSGAVNITDALNDHTDRDPPRAQEVTAANIKPNVDQRESSPSPLNAPTDPDDTQIRSSRAPQATEPKTKRVMVRRIKKI